MNIKNKKKDLANLTVKAAAIFGAALAALTGVNNQDQITKQDENFGSNDFKFKTNSKIKPMPLLKLNRFDPDNSQLVASHVSHRSHRSHKSHSSHYSHRSGAMFS